MEISPTTSFGLIQKRVRPTSSAFSPKSMINSVRLGTKLIIFLYSGITNKFKRHQNTLHIYPIASPRVQLASILKFPLYEFSFKLRVLKVLPEQTHSYPSSFNFCSAVSANNPLHASPITSAK